MKDGDETDTDCGGTCPKCDAGDACAKASDCTTGHCVAKVCVTSCMDGVKDGKESDVDCGGGVCPKCVAGKVCVTGNDCVSGDCANGACM